MKLVHLIVENFLIAHTNFPFLLLLSTVNDQGKVSELYVIHCVEVYQVLMSESDNDHDTCSYSPF